MNFRQGQQILFNDRHPHPGHRGVVLQFRDVDLWPELSQCGVACMVTDPGDARPDLRIVVQTR